MTPRAQQAVAYYVARGYTPVQAAGIVGNLMQESGPNLDLNAVGDNGTAFGIAQWRGDRLTNLQRFAASNGSDWRDFNTQLAFVDHELNTTERRAGDALRNASTVDDATAAMIGFERPQGWTTNNPRGGHGWNNRLRFASGLAGQGDPMAYTASGQPTAAAGAIDGTFGAPTARPDAPPPPAGSQRLFRSVGDAIAARRAGGTPRLDEIRNIRQQRMAGDTPFRDRIAYALQQWRGGGQQSAPTPPAPIPYAGSGGGASGGDPAVRALQERLQAAGFDPGPIDGLDGPQTQAAVRAFQQANGLTVDGIAGRQTMGALDRIGQVAPQTTASAVPLPRENPARPLPPLPPGNPSRMAAPPNPQARLDYRAPVQPAGLPAMPIGPAPGSLPGRGSISGPAAAPQPNARAMMDYRAPVQPAGLPSMPAGPAFGSLPGRAPMMTASAPVTPVQVQPLPPIAPQGQYRPMGLNVQSAPRPQMPAGPAPGSLPGRTAMATPGSYPQGRGNGVGVPTVGVNRQPLPVIEPDFGTMTLRDLQQWQLGQQSQGRREMPEAFEFAYMHRMALAEADAEAARRQTDLDAGRRRDMFGASPRIAPPAPPVERSIGEGEYLPHEWLQLAQLRSNMNNAPKAVTSPQTPFRGAFRSPLMTAPMPEGAPEPRRNLLMALLANRGA